MPPLPKRRRQKSNPYSYIDEFLRYKNPNANVSKIISDYKEQYLSHLRTRLYSKIINKLKEGHWRELMYGEIIRNYSITIDKNFKSQLREINNNSKLLRLLSNYCKNKSSEITNDNIKGLIKKYTSIQNPRDYWNALESEKKQIYEKRINGNNINDEKILLAFYEEYNPEHLESMTGMKNYLKISKNCDKRKQKEIDFIRKKIKNKYQEDPYNWKINKDKKAEEEKAAAKKAEEKKANISQKQKANAEKQTANISQKYSVLANKVNLDNQMPNLNISIDINTLQKFYLTFDKINYTPEQIKRILFNHYKNSNELKWEKKFRIQIKRDYGISLYDFTNTMLSIMLYFLRYSENTTNINENTIMSVLRYFRLKGLSESIDNWPKLMNETLKNKVFENSNNSLSKTPDQLFHTAELQRITRDVSQVTIYKDNIKSVTEFYKSLLESNQSNVSRSLNITDFINENDNCNHSGGRKIYNGPRGGKYYYRIKNRKKIKVYIKL